MAKKRSKGAAEKAPKEVQQEVASQEEVKETDTPVVAESVQEEGSVEVQDDTSVVEGTDEVASEAVAEGDSGDGEETQEDEPEAPAEIQDEPPFVPDPAPIVEEQEEAEAVSPTAVAIEGSDRELRNIALYTQKMGKNVVISKDEIIANQFSLFNALVAVLTKGDDAEGVKRLEKVLEIYLEHKDNCFTERLACRYIDEAGLLQKSQRIALTFLTVFFTRIADPKTRHALAKETDLPNLVKTLPAKDGEVALSRIRRICKL